MHKSLLAGLLTAGVAILAMSTAHARDYRITVSAPNHSYREAPVTVLIDAPKDFAGVALFQREAMVPVQAKFNNGKAEITWIVRDLKQGDKIDYRLTFERVGRGVPASGVTIDKVGTSNLDIRINNELFTRYDTQTGPNKPYFYPMYAPGNKRIVRRYPLETVEGETHDHPHHRGLWFTHGAVNGVDFWAEGGKTGATKHVRYEEVTSGPVYGSFRAMTDWVTPDGKKIAEDVRDVRVYNVANGRLMDFDVTMKPVGGPLVFGDTKEGSFGLRLPDTMRFKGGDGHIVNSEGVKDDATWGKPAKWVDYYGTADGEVLGVAILDHTSNLRHPTTWHVRDYGLFAVNPFGLHDFNNDKAHPNLGDHTVPAGGAQTFRYRIYIHKGSTSEANVTDAWSAYSDPPKVEVK
jgi:hypothetical protein